MKNKLSKKQTFSDLYGETVVEIAIILGIVFFLLLPCGLTGITKNFEWLHIYLGYILGAIIYHIRKIVIRYDRLTRLPLTQEEKEQLHITSAEDCLVFLNLYLKNGENIFTLFDKNVFLDQVLEFIRSSMTKEEIELETSYKLTSDYSELFYTFDMLPAGSLFYDIDSWKYYGGHKNWEITTFCQENFKKAIKENWTWEKYVKEKERTNKYEN